VGEGHLGGVLLLQAGQLHGKLGLHGARLSVNGLFDLMIEHENTDKRPVSHCFSNTSK
jgi:hypothetical protein